ncbi:MAG: hypothetical protein JWN03_3500 [Nocardia sp.]|nr:hypothetical protein [Nocardia sp.]
MEPFAPPLHSVQNRAGHDLGVHDLSVMTHGTHDQNTTTFEYTT